MKKYYEILEVSQNASIEVIEKTYKVLIKKYHPDQYPKEKKKYYENKVKELNEAYKVLSDDFLRLQYDEELEKENERINSRNSSIKENNARNVNYQNANENYLNEENLEQKAQKEKSKVGTLAGLIELTKELIKNKPKRDEVKEMTKKDIFAILLTIIIVILIGVALWFIPFTNGWMRELLFENPLFSWIFK